ncbi:MAG: PadR family transcriptional regulator [Asgard group archaeon]|nr:PadR family transcriptional regulator [Asgard group archaeon]
MKFSSTYHHPPTPPPPPLPPMPFGREMLKELRELVFLWTIAEESEGITGYDLQKNYQAKQTNVYRTLNEMTKKGYLTYQEKTVNGRAQKLFAISAKGQKHLDYLRKKWTARISFLTDIIPPGGRFFPLKQKHRQDHLLKEISQLENQEEVIDYLITLQHHYQIRSENLARHSDNLQQIVELIETTTKQIRQLPNFSSEKVNDIIKDMFENI